MKKILLIFSFLVSFTAANATHLMGGQITATNIGGNTYHIKLTLYRDTLGIPMPSTEDVYMADSTGTITYNFPLQLNASPAIVLGNGVEEYDYELNFTFYTTPSSHEYILYWNNCCRNAAILNLPNPLTNGMTLFTRIHVDINYSTPVFLNPPIALAQEGIPFTYNPLPYDPDGDSLSWTLDTPLDAPAVGFNIVPIPGYTLPPSDTSMPFTLDPVTGAISFLPNTVGHFVVSVSVNEYRAGVQIGQIRRDMQIIVVPDSNLLRTFSITSNITPTAARQIHIPAGNTLNLAVATADPVDSDYQSIRANGSIFQSVNPPTYTYTDSIGSATGLLSWTPTVAQASVTPYIVAFRTTEAHGNRTFSLDESFELFVDNTATALQPLNEKTDAITWTVKDNLLQGNMMLDKTSTVNIELINMLGEKMATVFHGTLNSGKHSFVYDTGVLKQSLFVVRTLVNGEKLSNKKIVVLH